MRFRQPYLLLHHHQRGNFRHEFLHYLHRHTHRWSFLHTSWQNHYLPRRKTCKTLWCLPLRFWNMGEKSGKKAFFLLKNYLDDNMGYVV